MGELATMEDLLRAIEAVRYRVEQHDDKTRSLGDGINKTLERQERTVERLEDSVGRLVDALDRSQTKLDPGRLVWFLVAAVILSSLGSEGLAILAKALGVGP